MKWTQGPKMLNQRERHACALFEYFDGTQKVIVTGGLGLKFEFYESTEILDLNNPTTWVKGPDLPKKKNNHSMVSLNGVAYIICGYDSFEFGPSNSIFRLACNQNCHWIKMKQELEIARYSTTATLVPYALTNCINKT